MKCEILTNRGSSRLLLLFSGWGVDSDVFSGVNVEGYDAIGVSDYSDDSFPLELIEGYAEIVAICWSYGVYMGARFLAAHPGLPVTLKVAVNGTLWPVDNDYGIPEQIFRGTLEGLSPATYAKFLRRTAGRVYPPSSRSLDSLREELSRIGTIYYEEGSAIGCRFDRAMVLRSDRIIPPANQLASWRRLGVEVTELDGSHLPDFPALIADLVVNKKRVGERFARSMATYARNAHAQKEIAAILAARLPSLGREVVEIGVGRGFLTEAVVARFGGARSFTLVDMLPCERPQGVSAEASISVEADAETWMMSREPDSYDAIISSSTMQWFNSQANFLRHCSRVVRSGGVVALATFGPETFRELDGLAPRLRMTHADTLARWAGEWFESVEVASDILSLTFDHPSEALRHIRLTGVNAVPDSTPVASAIRLARHYPRLEDGRCTLTYQPIYLILKNPIKHHG